MAHLTWYASVVDPDPHESALIWLSWIRMGNADQDLGAWELTKINKTWFSAFKKDIRSILIFFHVKIQLFETLKSGQVPVRHGSALALLPGSGSGSELRSKAGSGSAFKPMRIHNTGVHKELFNC